MRSSSLWYYLIAVTVPHLIIAAADAGEIYVDATFTYQGQLKQAGVPVNDTCDMRFKLRTNAFGTDETDVLATLFFDGSSAARPPVQVTNGLFNVVLDFHFSALAQRPVWLDVGVQCPPGANGFYEGLLPRQEITSVPYSVQTRGISVDEFERVGIGTTDPTSDLHIDGRDNNGIDAALRLESGGDVMLLDGNEIDSTGTLHLNLNSPSPVALGSGGGSVGIGTSTPDTKLEIVSDNDPTVSIRSDSTSGQSTGLSIRGARNDTTAADVASIDLRNFDDNEGAGTDFAMARIAAGMADAAGQTGYLRFKTNDGTGLAERLRIDKQGRVGIGITTPSAALHLRDPGAKVELKMSAGGSWTAGIRHTNASLLSFFNGSGATDRLTIGPGGNVGIGAESNSNFGRLVIGQGQDTADHGLSIFDDDGGQSLRLWVDATNVRRIDGGAGGQAVVAINGGGGGLVGIGTTQPASRLHIENGTDVNGADGGYLILGDLGGPNIGIDNNEIAARTNGAAAPLTLNADGGNIILGPQDAPRVGIGKSSPSVKLDVEGSSSDSGGVAGFNEVVARFHSTSSGHTAASIDSDADDDSILYFAESGEALWGLRVDAQTDSIWAHSQFELRYHAEGANEVALEVVRASNDNIFTVYTHGSVVPWSDNAYDLGAPSGSFVGGRWQDVWASNAFIQTSDIREKKDVMHLKYGLAELTCPQT